MGDDDYAIYFNLYNNGKRYYLTEDRELQEGKNMTI